MVILIFVCNALAKNPTSIPESCKPFGVCERCVESNLEDVYDPCRTTGRRQGYFCDELLSDGGTNTNINDAKVPHGTRIAVGYDSTIYVSCLRTPDEEAMRMLLFIGFMIGLGGYFYYATQVRKTLSLSMFETRKLEHRTNFKI